MATTSIIQIGDVHLPWSKNERAIDHKDERVTPGLVLGLALPTLQAVIRKLVRVYDAIQPACTLICGDLSAKGSTDDYAECVTELVAALDLADRDSGSIHVVPGNHDVDRRLCVDKDELNLEAKFAPLSNAWMSAGVDALAVAGVRATEFNYSAGKTAVFSVNSCIGCGEWRVLPARIRHELGALIETVSSEADEDSFSLVGEQLDTPMFLAKDVEELSVRIEKLSAQHLPIILSHHNILPQAEPRVDVYTEMINSGAIRTMLTQHARPIVYCHGHIHTDPIEIVSDGTHPTSRLVVVSAPLITKGFNVLTVHHSRDKCPIGLVVEFYRTQPNSHVTLSDTHRISLLPFASCVTMDEDLSLLEGCLSDRSIRFEELRNAVNAKRATSANRHTLTELLVEAEWRCLVGIDNRDGSPEHWIVRRTHL